MSPTEVRKPTTPQNAAGGRSEPPRSEPRARGPPAGRRAAAGAPRAGGGPPGAPPPGPPQVSAGFHGLRVAPKTALKVLPPAPNSGGLALPPPIAPRRLPRGP